MGLRRIRAALQRALLRTWLPKAQLRLLGPLDRYSDWIDHNALNHWRRVDLAQALARQRELLPCISVIMPVYRPDLAMLSAAIESVQRQYYDNWQLCICDDGSEDPRLDALLAELTKNEPRIRVINLPENSGISAASNWAARLATGDFLLFLDQDDLLAEECLAEFALAFAANSSLDLAYSDHDKIDQRGRRHAPQFKPGWSPVLLLSHMYCGHALALRRSLFEAIGGMRSAFDGSQDYDLALRATEQARQVLHIPKVLYHWRVTPGSTAVSANEKPGSIAAGQACLAEAIARRQIPASVAWGEWARAKAVGLFELQFCPGPEPLAVIAFEDDQACLTVEWLDNLAKVLPREAELVTLRSDGGPLGRRLRQLPEWLAGRNLVLIRAATKIVSADTITQLTGYAALPGAGLAAPRTVDRRGRIVSAGLILPESTQQLEAALFGADRRRSGMCYFAQAAHECAAVAADCIALHHSQAPLLAELAPDINDHWELGLRLTETLKSRDGRPICVAQCTVEVDGGTAGSANFRPGGIDLWYNPNLGSRAWQFEPMRRGPGPHQKAAVKLAVLAHNLDREGAQLMLLELLAGLVESNLFEIVLYSPKDGALRGEFVAAGIRVELVSAPGRRDSMRAFNDYIRHLAERFRTEGCHVVLANTLESYAAIHAAEQAGLRSVWWQHEGGHWDTYFRRMRWPRRALAYSSFGLPYRVVQVAASTYTKWLPVATRANFEVIGNGLGHATITALTSRHGRTSARASLGITDDECGILLVGSISSRKGQADMVTAIAGLSETALAMIRVWIVGEQVDKAYCQALMAAVDRLPESRRSRIVLAGAVEDLARYYAAADLFVCCSRQESAPRALVEAMAFGLPIVSTAVDGIPELVAFGKNGISYQTGNAQALSNILAKLAASPIDRKRLGQASRDQVLLVNNHYAMVHRFQQLFREAAMLRSDPPS